MRLIAWLVLLLAIWMAVGYFRAWHRDDREQHQWGRIQYQEVDCDPRLGCGYN